jgi:tetratricopeptide (TPR) repeat protein
MKQLLLTALVSVITLVACSQDKSEVINNPYERGLSFASQGKFEKAVDAFKQALNTADDKRPAQESLEVVETVLSGQLDQQAAVNFFKGISHANKGQFVHAYSHLSKAIKSAPDFADAYYERGSVNGSMNYYDKAISDFTKAAELHPGDAAAFNNRGLAYAKGLNDYERAIADFSAAIKVNPQFAEAYDNRAIAFMKQSEDKQQACADWKQACELKRCRSFETAKANGYCE